MKVRMTGKTRIALADRLAETAREVIEERESYWGSTDGIRRHDPEHAALMDALAAYRSPEKEGERDEEV
jgi:hypothetical protein